MLSIALLHCQFRNWDQTSPLGLTVQALCTNEIDVDAERSHAQPSPTGDFPLQPCCRLIRSQTAGVDGTSRSGAPIPTPESLEDLETTGAKRRRVKAPADALGGVHIPAVSEIIRKALISRHILVGCPVCRLRRGQWSWAAFLARHFIALKQFMPDAATFRNHFDRLSYGTSPPEGVGHIVGFALDLRPGVCSGDP